MFLCVSKYRSTVMIYRNANINGQHAKVTNSMNWHDTLPRLPMSNTPSLARCLHPTSCERSELSGQFNGTDFLNLSLYILLLYNYIFQAVRRAVNVLNVSTCI